MAHHTSSESPAFGPAALKLARVLNAIRFDSLSDTAREHARMILASTIASASAGRNLDSARIVRGLAGQKRGVEEASVWFERQLLPMAEAARVNAVASDAAASDDSDLRNVAHIGTTLTAAGLAVGERVEATGPDLLAAMVAGYEAAGRIGEAIAASSDAAQTTGAINAKVGRGFHASATVAFAGTVTAAKLLRLTDAEVANALALTATSVGGLSISSNSAAREYHAGNATLTAINAVLAAKSGFTVNPDMLEAPGGFLSVFGGGVSNPEPLERELSGEPQISRYLAVKLLPGAHALHCAVEAAVNAANQLRGSANDVEKILVAGPQSALAASARAPKDVIEAIHSLPYYLATAVADRDFNWSHTDPRLIERPVIARLIALVEQDPTPPQLDYEWSWSATVTLVTKSAERSVSTVQAPRGSALRGIEWADVEAKYRALTPHSGLPSRQLDRALEAIINCEDVTNLAGLTKLLTPPA